MTDSIASLRRQLDSAADLQSVVRTMKAIAAASIGQYEQSVQALADYERTVAIGLGACLRSLGPQAKHAGTKSGKARPVINAVIFGSDQGLVGRFNEAVTGHAIEALAGRPGEHRIRAVGERAYTRLIDADMAPLGRFPVPASVGSIAPLIGQILMDGERQARYVADSELWLFYNSPRAGASYTSVSQRLLPLDEDWQESRIDIPWPGGRLPEVLGGVNDTLAALIGEYVFVSVFRACAQSLASENSSRLAAMQRADKNIDQLQESLREDYHRLRQDGIDAELFDVISGVEALR